MTAAALALAAPATAAPGELVGAEPIVARDAGGLTALPGRAWRIQYRSTSATGRPNVVSGTVLVPDAPAPGPRPLVGLSVGTRGIADRCAPSHTLTTGREPEADTIRAMLERGWAVAVTDWEGLGTPGDHTYVVGRAEGHAVLDAVRAARGLPDAGLPGDGPLALLGYSQGGHSTSWAAQVQPAYAPELRLAGVAAGAVPADLHAVADHVDGGYAAGLVIYAAIGMDAAYPELQLDRYLTAEGREAVAAMRDSCLLDGTLLRFSFRRTREFTTTDVPRLPEWKARLEENGVGALAPAAPVLVYHARGDDLIPFRLGEQLRDRWCARGVNVRLREVPGVDHTVTATTFGTPPALEWLAERFASGPPPHPAQCAAPAPAATRPAWPRLRLVLRRDAVRVTGGPLRDLVVRVRDAGGRLAGRTARRDVGHRALLRLRVRRPLRPGRYRLTATATRPDGLRVRAVRAVRLP